MSTMTKVFVVLTSVVAIVLSCLTVATAARWSNQKGQIESYQELYQAEFVRRMNLESMMAVSLAMKDDALRENTDRLSDSKEEVRRLTSDLQTRKQDLARETNERTRAQAARKKLEEILAVQTSELTSIRKQYQELLTEKIDLQTRNTRLASRVLELTSQTAIATDEIRNLQEKLYAEQQRTRELEQAVAAGPRVGVPADVPVGAVAVSPLASGPIEGEIVEVDGHYVSINVGETSGVVTGMPFMVYRGETYVADLQVETVRPKEAGGKLTMLAPGQAVQRGDRVAWGLD